jgi:17beta-estradiol 17-dehydrogenase / very-long-chain 3-oxoacyl-CoA reductase
MNKKDQNLFKGLGLLIFLCLTVIGGGLWVFGNDPLRLVGFLVCIYGAARAAFVLYKAFVLKPADPRKFGSWAIVTGCTGGLGQEFAHRCAARGLNLVLVSRSKTKLDTLAAELKETYGIDAVVLVFDFFKSSTAEEEAFYMKELPEFLAASPVESNVALLVNNVGVGDEAPYGVSEITTADVAGMVKVNCGAIVNMSRSVLPLFKHRKGGCVINVSSGSCAQPSPYLATYASSKAFDLHFSKSCSREFREFGVHVLGIRPYYIAGTGLYPNAKASLNAPAARTIVEGAFSHLGKYEVSHAYWVHGAMGWLFGTLFEDPIFAALVERAAKRGKVNGSMLMIQKAARTRSQAKRVEEWKPINDAAEEHLRRLGCK